MPDQTLLQRSSWVRRALLPLMLAGLVFVGALAAWWTRSLSAGDAADAAVSDVAGVATRQQLAEIVLGPGMALLGGGAEPADGLLRIHGDAPAALVAAADHVEGVGVAGSGGDLEPAQRRLRVLDLRLRVSVQWHVRDWRTALFVNHTGGYTNPTVTPAESVDDWTTADLTVAYTASWLADTRLTLSVLNLTDEDPPFVSSPLAQFAFGFDATNASALGRFVALGLSKQW